MCGILALWSEFSHDNREVLRSNHRFEMNQRQKAVSTHNWMPKYISVRFITHLYCLAVQASFYSRAVEILMCMQSVTGSILSRCKDDWQIFLPCDI